jgi:2-methylisocitrate lyase-like PEP mutase family enzyme
MVGASQDAKFAAFRALHQREGSFVIPNPWNAGTARMLAAVGFEALATTSAGYAFQIGKRDADPSITRAGILANAREIAAAVDVPVSADLQNGFGDAPKDCAATIHKAAAEGLVGGSIEDATGNSADPIYDFNHAVERIAAAAEAAKALPFLLTARAENYLHGRPDLDDTIKRLQAFSKAGASVLYAPGLSRIEDIRALCAAVDKPVNVVMGLKGKPFTMDELRDAGVKRVSVGGSFARAALGALVRAALEVKDQGTFNYAAQALTSAEAEAFMEPVHGDEA